MHMIASTIWLSLLRTTVLANGTAPNTLATPTQPQFPLKANRSSISIVSLSSLVSGTGIPIFSSTFLDGAPHSSSVLFTIWENNTRSVLSENSGSVGTITLLPFLSSSASLHAPFPTDASSNLSATSLSSRDIFSSIYLTKYPSVGSRVTSNSTALRLWSNSTSKNSFSLMPSSTNLTITTTYSSSVSSSFNSSPKSAIGTSASGDLALSSSTVYAVSSTSDRYLLPASITTTPSLTTAQLSAVTGVHSMASELSMLFVDAYPILTSWYDSPKGSEKTAVANKIDEILPKAKHLLGKLPKPTDGVEPCKRRIIRRDEPISIDGQAFNARSFIGGLFKTAFSLVSCVIDTTNTVKDQVVKGTTDAVGAVKDLQDDLVPMVDALNEVVPPESPEDPTTAQTKATSTSLCSMRTASDCRFECTVYTATTIGGQGRWSTNERCTTRCEAPTTSCGATGVTSSSTVTSTISSYRGCSPDCTECNEGIPTIPTDVPDLSIYSRASNGVLYLPATTKTKVEGKSATVGAGGQPSQGTASSISISRKRALSHPTEENGDVGMWLRIQLATLPYGHLLAHGTWGGPLTTGFTFPLRSTPDTWGLMGLYGCTSVIVISRKRIFMAHIFENPTMRTPQHLQSHVLDSLRNGDAGVPFGLTAFTGPGGDFKDTAENKVRAFIVTPYRRGVPNPTPDDLEFPYEVGKIDDLLKDVLGCEGAVIPYVARSDIGLDTNMFYPKGKVLIQYDPVSAYVHPVNGGCDTQIAEIELWFEDHPVYRYRDWWLALPNQIAPANALPGRSVTGKTRGRQWLRGGPVDEVDEKAWEEYRRLVERQGGNACSRPSESTSTSASLTSSKTHDRTTFETSLTSYSRGNESSSSSSEASLKSTDTDSSTKQPSKTTTATKEQPSTTESSLTLPSSSSQGSSPSPSPSPTPSKGLSIILRYVDDNDVRFNTWTFYEILNGKNDHGCDEPVLDDEATRWTDSDYAQKSLDTPGWPWGTFNMKLFGEECQYQADGSNPGVLHCPSMGAGKSTGCLEDPQRTEQGRFACNETGTRTVFFHRVVLCKW